MNKDEFAAQTPFPIGQANDDYAQYFTGQSYLQPLSQQQVNIFNVTFGVAGRGYYQEWGKDAIEMKPGDCINVPANVKHWHGAAPDSWFQHLAIEVPGEDTSNEWREPVSDEEYSKLK